MKTLYDYYDANYDKWKSEAPPGYEGEYFNCLHCKTKVHEDKMHGDLCLDCAKLNRPECE